MKFLKHAGCRENLCSPWYGLEKGACGTKFLRLSHNEFAWHIYQLVKDLEMLKWRHKEVQGLDKMPQLHSKVECKGLVEDVTIHRSQVSDKKSNSNKEN